ncbi:hypothetical protein M405DRAFT_840448 [Rhizopogon salebrosus TDB-379]|nr:hypothetical protein M405DRAFT_840448 [Rhizopogon salebrosus TDB-379]
MCLKHSRPCVLRKPRSLEVGLAAQNMCVDYALSLSGSVTVVQIDIRRMDSQRDGEQTLVIFIEGHWQYEARNRVEDQIRIFHEHIQHQEWKRDGESSRCDLKTGCKNLSRTDESALRSIRSRDMAQKSVITYVSRREWGRRMLIQEDYERLVEELYQLRDQYGCEVNVVSMDKLTRAEQIALAARITVRVGFIMMGVHGNRLTSLVWMRPSPRATVMEFFFPWGFAYDCEYTTCALEMVHYGFWGNMGTTHILISHRSRTLKVFKARAFPLMGLWWRSYVKKFKGFSAWHN